MSSNYIRGASVTALESQAEIGAMLAGSGATGFRCTWEHGRAAIAFIHGACRYRMVLDLPRAAEFALHRHPTGPKTAQESGRQRWRALSALVRAKLEAVDAGIVAFDDEFLAYTLEHGAGRADGVQPLHSGGKDGA
ncbi:hypothetical protein [Sinomonas flava]